MANFDLINDLNKLYKSKYFNQKNEEPNNTTTLSSFTVAITADDVSSSNLVDEMSNGTNYYFYENDLNLLKLNSMNIDMDVNNLEQTMTTTTKSNATNDFIEMMMIDNMDFTVEEYIDEDVDEQEPIMLYSQMNESSFASNNSNTSTSSALSSSSSLSSVSLTSREANASFSQVTNNTSTVNSTSGSSRIKMQNSYVLLKRRMMQQMNKRKHLNKSETVQEQTMSEHILKDKRFRNKGQRVKHARKFYQRQRTSSTKLSIDLNDTSLTKLKASNEINNNTQNINETNNSNNNNSQTTRDEMLTPNVTVSSSKSETSNLKSYKPSFKVEKLLNDSRGMKKYLIDYDCLMTSSKQQQQQYSSIGKVGKTFSLNNLSNLIVNESNFDSIDFDNDNICYMGAAATSTTTTASSFSSIQLNKLLDLNECDKSILDEIHHSFIKINKSGHKAEITLENLSDCIMKKMKKIDQVNEEIDEDGEHQVSNSNDENDEELEYDELLEKKSFSSISNKCSSGYLSDF